MEEFNKSLNDLLVDTFNTILKVEEKMIHSMGKYDLSISELHLLETVRKGNKESKTISEIAKRLDITLPSVTIAVNKLVKKGYLEKKKCEEDARSVQIFLTAMGLKIDRLHQRFHEHMVTSIAKVLSEDEKHALVSGMYKLKQFFNQRQINS